MGYCWSLILLHCIDLLYSLSLAHFTALQGGLSLALYSMVYIVNYIWTRECIFIIIILFFCSFRKKSLALFLTSHLPKFYLIQEGFLGIMSEEQGQLLFKVILVLLASDTVLWPTISASFRICSVLGLPSTTFWKIEFDFSVWFFRNFIL